MNQLSNNVIDLALYRRARDATRGRTASDGPAPAGQPAHMPLAARRRQRPVCLRLGRAQGDRRSAASFATLSGKLKDPPT